MSLKINDNGTWRTILEPYVNVDGNWHTVHKIHIKHGDAWRVSHTTNLDRYTEILSATHSTDGSVTIAPGVRFFKAVLTGSGGGAGGGMRSSGDYSGRHIACPISTNSAAYTVAGYDYATGGPGGNGGKVEAVINCNEGDVFNFTVGGGGGGGGSGNLYLRGTSGYGVGTTASGADGANGTATQLTGPESTSLSAGGGIGGGKAVLTVSASCYGCISGQSGPEGFVCNASAYGQTVSASGSGSGTGGVDTASGSKIHTQSLTGVGSSGGAGVSNGTGGAGSNGSITISQFRASEY